MGLDPGDQRESLVQKDLDCVLDTLGGLHGSYLLVGYGNLVNRIP